MIDLPRDVKGKFLPAGSVNEFVKKEDKPLETIEMKEIDETKEPCKDCNCIDQCKEDLKNGYTLTRDQDNFCVSIEPGVK